MKGDNAQNSFSYLYKCDVGIQGISFILILINKIYMKLTTY